MSLAGLLQARSLSSQQGAGTTASMTQQAAAAAAKLQTQSGGPHKVLNRQMDSVRSYFGVRDVSLGRVGPGGHLRPLINGKFVFQIGMLDQVSETLVSRRPPPCPPNSQ